VESKGKATKNWSYLKVIQDLNLEYSRKRQTKRGFKCDMQLALEAIATKKISIRQATKYYGIPPSSIQDWKKGKTFLKTMGHQTYLGEVL